MVKSIVSFIFMRIPNNFNMKKILLFLALTLPLLVVSQNLDSLYQEAKKIKNDSTKLFKYNAIAFKSIFSNPDNAIKIIKEGKTIAQEKNENYGLTILTNTQGIYFDVTGKSDSAKLYFKKALKLSQDFGFEDVAARCVNNLGMANWNSGDFQTALNYFFESLKMDDAKGNRKSSASSLNNIGLIYQEMGLNEKALEYHSRALKIRQEFNMKNAQIASYNNIGINLKEINRLDEAEEAYKKGVALAKAETNLLEYYRLLENLANVYNLQDKSDLALKTYLEIINRPKTEGSDKTLFSVYNNITDLYNGRNEPKKAMIYIKKALELLKQYPSLENSVSDFYLNSAETNFRLQNYNIARSQKKLYVQLKDSIFSNEMAKSMADFEVKYETEKKERQILEQRAKIAENEVVIQKRNYQIYGALALALILGILGYLFYNQQRLKNQQLEKENQLRDALVKIETQNKLQEQRLRISRDLHDNIGAQLTFIISSIDNLKYGFNIDDKKLNSKLETISSFASSTIRELRDTIWAMNKDRISFEDLQIRISNFIDKANLSDADIAFSFTVDNSVDTSKSFTSVEGMNIYRVIQEAINNSLKYAKASEIRVEFFEENSNLKLKILDNGNGFDVKKTTDGNGLSNMKKRAEEINANLTIKSAPANGTQISLILNK
ncbi:histidine kinase/DNA gyrase B/HSP90-like ATPase [Winogradskyella wandonensis]|uniref:Histidine kinase/DNA gyrase B/HSP90-like ATPase n=2 Tax=Winogradskyella wandonensis TaxID=1442586 RepID=A0A4R1KPC8_9FLAO|nr:histidine kinase/DNA gyrase B/HSP90-like ATPase [Winogradskyella wandonensis]